MRTLRLSVLAVLAAVGLVTLAARPLQDAKGDGFDPAAMAEMMTLAQPGPEHEELTALAGEWEMEVALHMAPGAEPMRQTAHASCRPILGGRFLEIVAKGDFMGQPFESVTMLGFDRRHGQWTMVGFDTLGTYWVTAKGTRGEDGVIRLHGRDDDPTGEQVFRHDMRIAGPDAFSQDLYFEKIGPQSFDEPFLMSEVAYKRK